MLYIERRFDGFYSLEKVFRQIAKYLPERDFETSFQQAGFGTSLGGIIRNLLSFRPQTADIYHITGQVTFLALILPRERTVVTIPDDLEVQKRDSPFRVEKDPVRSADP